MLHVMQVKHGEDVKNKYGSDDESDDEGAEETADNSTTAEQATGNKELVIYKQLMLHLKPEETVQKALKRLGGGKKLTSAQKWKLKKQQKQNSEPESSGNMEAMLQLTELVNKIVELGNMDVYQETYEMISVKVKRAENNEPALDMFAEVSEAAKQGEAALGGSALEEVRWQLRWENKDEAELEGPYTASELVKWQESGKLSKGAYVRKMGSSDTAWYHTNRIDFELYV
ncbi:hypothetical protein HAZT_HAZT005305 [Hyalella azteca]|uniref:GYF domain-containing protein n=1 Tax=Hyalella azteca TaxID=294128 RepID=A0A6A0GWR5_HYAAZ|nr:hypothetical protein HAZT_HAZT005305 [Hyalella azteca]